MNVANPKISPREGMKTMIPWIFSFSIGVFCTALVAAVTVMWSEEKTRAWLECTLLGLFWKLFVIDPAKSVFCGTLLEPIVTLLFGDGASDAGLNTAAEELDGRLEDAADAAGDQGEAIADVGADMVVDGGNWGTESARGADYVASEARRVAATAVITSVVASKVSNKLTRSRARRASVEHLNALKEDDMAVQHSMSIRRQRSRTLYAEKVKQKRLKKGLTVGSFALKAEKDAIAFAKSKAAPASVVVVALRHTFLGFGCKLTLVHFMQPCKPAHSSPVTRSSTVNTRAR
eukprot:COSAG01_NODE_437_length_17047_cov_194.928015_2_plen_290_part_00